MSQEPQKNDYRALLQQALIVLEQMEAKVRAAERAQHEPIAIIGMGFRFPGGANDAASFWKLLSNGTDAIREVPPDRWNADQFYDPDPDATGKMYTRWGGFLDQVDQFDPQFFGISAREAVSMDPQQRLLLETTWEALENAGQASSKLSGSRTGVFVGMVGSDYANLKMISGGINDVDAYFGTGISRSIAAGRIAYTFGLHGPALAVDTACSSSIVATHQACQSLRLKECDMAITGGVNLILEPSGSISTSRARMMSMDGHCKTFDTTADGYVRSEGCAMIVLKRLSDALNDGDNILAVIRGTAMNQDGRSNGLTAPNGKAQEAVIRAALDDAQVKAANVSFVETHGTGTSLGDPIEVRALGAVFGENHTRTDPLMIGSVKTNVGHLEAAAGIVGLVKVVLALQNKTIPPHIHLNELNPYIPWNELPIKVPTAATEWTTTDGKPRIAGLSSFGFSGTNTHMVIAEAPAQKIQEATCERSAQLFTLSAKTEPTLKELAQNFETYLKQNPSASLADTTYSLNLGRSHFDQRLAFPADSLAQTQEKLSGWIQDHQAFDALAETGKPEVAFLFTGQGAQNAGMARELYNSQPTFRKMMDHCDEILRPHLEKPLLSVIYPEHKGDEDLIHQTRYTQPALFAVGYSLAKLWQSWGVEPAVVMGHSVGEYTAACIAGVFTLEDGLNLIAARGRLMQSVAMGGVMVSVFADEVRVRDAIAPYQQEVSIAALNGPGAVVISGAASSVGLIVASLEKDGIKSQALNVSHAFHSPLMDPIQDEFEKIARSIQYHSPQIGLISNVTGTLITDDSIANAAYWRKHARQTVRFAESIRTLHEQSLRFFLEIGPNPTLLGMAKRCEPIHENDVWLPSLRTGRNDWEQMLESLAQLYVNGQDVDWDSFERDYKDQRRQLPLPTYPFQRERYWLNFETSNTAGIKTDHPLLGSRLATAMPIFQKQLTTSNPAYLNDHCIHNMVILPAAAYFEIALAAAKHSLNEKMFVLENVSIHEALPLSSDSERLAQIILTKDDDGASFQYFSRETNSEDEWKLHADGRIGYPADTSPINVPLDELRTRLSRSMPVDAYYKHLATVGAGYGPAFRAIESIWRTDGEALGKIKLSDSLTGDLDKYSIHPALLDACFQLLGTAVPGADDMDRAENKLIYVPVGIRSMRVNSVVGDSVYCHVQLHLENSGAKTLSGDLTIFNEEGNTVAIVHGLLLQQIDQQSLRRAMQVNIDDWLHEINWIETPNENSIVPWQGQGTWLIFAEDGEASRHLVKRLQDKGETCHLVYPGREFLHKDSNHWIIDPLQLEHFKRLVADLPKPVRGILHLWSLPDELNDNSTLDDLRSVNARNITSVLQLVQALSTQNETTPRLWLVTKGAQCVTERGGRNPSASMFWGLGNVIALEQPAQHCVHIDLDPAKVNDSSLFHEIWEPDGEDHVALRGETRFVARLAQSHRTTQAPQPQVGLVIKDRGVLDNLSLQPIARRNPNPGEVEMEVHATGLNFRDVLNALGMYPGDAGPLGSECAGVIAAIGDQVSSLKIGDPVIALTGNCFSSHVNVPANLVVQKPASLTFAEAATIPIAFLTADYALNTLAKMKAGDRVLIHAAAGGVGMAAVQLAQRAGAEIFGTAGTDEKRQLLKSLGVQHIMNSRTLDFANEILSITNGEGVDIVLNSLAGEFIPKSISVLKDNGCFVEIGKTDVWDEKRAKELKNNIRYFILYLGEILDQNPLLIRRMLLDLLAGFEDGTLKPLPQQIFTLEKVVDAFRFMAQAKHVGKIVITQSHQNAAVRSDGTYLITGGLGGLGLITARWLVNQGARHLALIGRSVPSQDAQHALDEMTSQGAVIYTAQVNISQRDQVENLLHYIQENMPTLRGVIHAAGVLDDGILLEQTWTRFETVMAPKVDGAWNLHTLTQTMPLDFFILFSAGASLLGSAGQSNYAAANSFLDGLAHYRRSQGLPALSINWGAWGDVGMAAKLGSQRRWTDMDLIKADDGMRAMQRLLERDVAQAGVLPMNWKKATRENDADVRPLLRLLVQSGSPAAGSESSTRRVSFLEQLKNAPQEEQYVFLFEHVRSEVNKVLGLDAAHSPNPRQGFTDIGLDSLMAVELSNRLQKSLERRLPSTLTFEHPTIEALTKYLAADILAISTEAPAGTEQKDKQKEAISAEVDAIADENLEDALLDELKDAGY